MNQDVLSLVIKITSWAQEELGAQRRMLALLGEQEQAIRAVDTQALTEASRRIEGEIAGGLSRERRRTRLLNQLGSAWHVDPLALTLGSICERAGAQAQGLAVLRQDLRDTTARALRQGRRIATLARSHSGLLDEVLHVLAGEVGDAGDGREGVLISAEA